VYNIFNMFKENLTPMAFQFNATSQEISSVLIKNEPYFIAKDICKVLALKNVSVSTSTLDEDEKADVSISYTSSNGTTQKRKVKVISESGLYALIMRSNKPEARVFRKWVTQEVLPTIRKKGYYSTSYLPSTFIDVRDVPFAKEQFNGFTVRVVTIKKVKWYSIADIHKCIGSQTSVTQAVKKLNIKQVLAKKLWLFGATHPAWFTTQLGFKLILSGSKVFSNNSQLKLL